MIKDEDGAKSAHRSHLFTLRVWAEELGDDQIEWRGQVQHVLSGEMRYFRTWTTLVEYVVATLARLEGNEGPSKFD